MSVQRIYKTTDRIEIKVDNISIFISPLTYHHKMTLNSLMIAASNGDMMKAMDAVKLALKVAIKDIKGVVTSDDQGNDVPYSLSFNGDELSDDSIDELLNMPQSQKITHICTLFLNGVPDQILGANQEPLEGVSIVKSKVEKLRKK